ncbi:hypothetical protein niasHT_009835 [Heterodera trifolii]|uniref:Uncharacterized protein n=1 Tax=Heterodera trifolii TaxID=157864 RepID=A0ABD2LU27_9BILA
MPELTELLAKCNLDMLITFFEARRRHFWAVKCIQLLNQILRIPSSIERPDDLLEMAQSFEYSVTDHLITELRKKYQTSGLELSFHQLNTLPLCHASTCQKRNNCPLYPAEMMTSPLRGEMMTSPLRGVR